MATTEVILTENLSPLGAEADIVKVRRGYARNFLIPTGKALEANAGSMRAINHLKAKRAEREGRELNEAEELASRINKLRLNLTLDTGAGGKAFGSITAKDLTDKVETELQNVKLPRHAVVLDKGIKESGDHEVPVKLHPDLTAKLKVKVTANQIEPTEKPEDDYED
ncbi:MAG: 50S ribosomal protein L9 [Chthoniobacterales bacterium]